MPVSPGAKGSGGLIAQPDRLSWNPTSGATRQRAWKSVNNDLVNAQADLLRGYLLPYDLSSTGTVFEVAVQIPGGAVDPATALQPLDRWEMPGNEIQMDKWMHPKAAIISADVATISRRHINDGKTLHECLDDIAAMSPRPDTGWTPTQYAVHGTIYSEVSQGSTHFEVGQYVLKHTTNVGAAYAENISDLNVEKLYTREQLLAETTDPLLWAYPLPGRLQYKIMHLVPPPTKEGYLWSWRKLPSTEATATGGRIEISTEYWLYLWSTFDYDPVT